MDTCKDCKYFRKNTIYGRKNYGYCECDKLFYEKSFLHDEEIKESDNLIYWDAENYAAGFEVGENFGCIHFTRKE